jgi:hypothetical protein
MTGFARHESCVDPVNRLEQLWPHRLSEDRDYPENESVSPLQVGCAADDFA